MPLSSNSNYFLLGRLWKHLHLLQRLRTSGTITYIHSLIRPHGERNEKFAFRGLANISQTRHYNLVSSNIKFPRKSVQMPSRCFTSTHTWTGWTGGGGVGADAISASQICECTVSLKTISQPNTLCTPSSRWMITNHELERMWKVVAYFKALPQYLLGRTPKKLRKNSTRTSRPRTELRTKHIPNYKPERCPLHRNVKKHTGLYHVCLWVTSTGHGVLRPGILHVAGKTFLVRKAFSLSQTPTVCPGFTLSAYLHIKSKTNEGSTNPRLVMPRGLLSHIKNSYVSAASCPRVAVPHTHPELNDTGSKEQCRRYAFWSPGRVITAATAIQKLRTEKIIGYNHVLIFLWFGSTI